MGIQDRDYMKRRPDEDGREEWSSDETEAIAQKFANRNLRYFWYLVAFVGVLIVIAIIADKFSGAGH